jgi:hypothetical protein
MKKRKMEKKIKKLYIYIYTSIEHRQLHEES